MAELTKKDIQKIVRDTIKNEFEDKFLPIKKAEKLLKSIEEKITKDDFKKLMIRLFKEQNRYMWEKSSYISHYINKI